MCCGVMLLLIIYIYICIFIYAIITLIRNKDKGIKKNYHVKMELTVDIYEILLAQNSISMNNKIHVEKESGGMSLRFEA